MPSNHGDVHNFYITSPDLAYLMVDFRMKQCRIINYFVKELSAHSLMSYICSLELLHKIIYNSTLFHPKIMEKIPYYFSDVM